MSSSETSLFPLPSAHPIGQHLKHASRLSYLDQSRYLRKIFVDFLDWDKQRDYVPRHLAASHIQALSLPKDIPLEHLEYETPLVTKTVLISIQPSTTHNKWQQAPTGTPSLSIAEKRLIVRAILRKASMIADEASLTDELLEAWKETPTHHPRISVSLCYHTRFSSTGTPAIEAHSLPLILYAGNQSTTEIRKSATETCISEISFYGQAIVQALDLPAALAPGRLLIAIAGVGLPTKNIVAADNLLLMDVRQFLLEQTQIQSSAYSIILVDHLPMHEHRVEIRYGGESLITKQQLDEQLWRLFGITEHTPVTSWGFGPSSRFPQPCLVARTHEAINLSTFHSMGVLAPRTALHLHPLKPSLSVRLLHYLLLHSEQPALHGSVAFAVARGGWKIDTSKTSAVMTRVPDTWYIWFQGSVTTFPLTLIAERLTPVLTAAPTIEHMPGRETYCKHWLRIVKKSSPHLATLLERMVTLGPNFYAHHRSDLPCVPYEFRSPADGFRPPKKSAVSNVSDNFIAVAKRIHWGANGPPVAAKSYKQAAEEYYSDDDNMDDSAHTAHQPQQRIGEEYRTPLWSTPADADEATLVTAVNSSLSFADSLPNLTHNQEEHRLKRSHVEPSCEHEVEMSTPDEAQTDTATLTRRILDLEALRTAQVKEKDNIIASQREQYTLLQAEYEVQFAVLAATQLRLQQAEVILSSAPAHLQAEYRSFLEEFTAQSATSSAKTPASLHTHAN